MKKKEARIVVLVIDGPSIDDWKAMEIDNELAPLQKLVGGYIEAVHFPSGKMEAYVNEEGFLIPLPVFAFVCGRPIAGPIVLMGPVVGEGEASSFTPGLLEEVERYIRPAQSIRDTAMSRLARSAIKLLASHHPDITSVALGSMRIEVPTEATDKGSIEKGGN